MVDEVMTRGVLWHLSARLPNWTVWYGEHTGHFWALFKGRSNAVPLYVEARIATDLESRAVEIEQQLLGPRVDPRGTGLPTGVVPFEGPALTWESDRPGKDRRRGTAEARP